MALFDFFDLNSLGPALEAAAKAPDALYRGQKQGEDLFKSELDMKQKATDAMLKEMRMPTEIMLQNLGDVQKLNIMPMQPTEEDRSAAMAEVSTLYKPQLEAAKTPEEKAMIFAQAQNAVEAKAQELAQARAPQLDPFDPTNFLRETARINPPLSDLRGKELIEGEKAAAALEKARLAQEAQDKRQAERLAQMLGIFQQGQDTKVKLTREQIAAENARNRNTVGASLANNRHTQANNLLQDLTKQFGGKRYFGKSERQQIVERVKAIEAVGDPTVSSAAKSAFKKVLDQEGYSSVAALPPGGGIMPGVPGAPPSMPSRDPGIEAYAKKYRMSYDKAAVWLRQNGYGK